MKIIKNPVFMFILGVVTCTITTVLASSLIANNISYTPQDKTWGVTNVGAALDSLMLSKTSDNYSTEEKVVGTWIDGKKIYQKTYRSTLPDATSTSSATGQINVSDLNVDDTINIFGYSKVTSGGTSSWAPLNISINKFNSLDIATTISAWVGGQNIVIRNSNQQWNGSETYVTIQYTKTTD